MDAAAEGGRPPPGPGAVAAAATIVVLIDLILYDREDAYSILLVCYS